MGKIWDPYGIEIDNFICRHRECGPVQCFDDHTDPYPTHEDWRCVEAECASPDNFLINAWNLIHYRWWLIVRSVKEVFHGRR